jgi:hypothetical protein
MLSFLLNIEQHSYIEQAKCCDVVTNVKKALVIEMKFIKTVTYYIFISGFQGVTVAWFKQCQTDPGLVWYEINVIKKQYYR